MTSPSGTIPLSSGYDTPTFTWNSVTNAASYSFYLYDNTSKQSFNVGGLPWTMR